MSDKPYFENETIDNIIGREPGWLVHSGLSILAGFILVLLLLSYFITVPETIKAEIIIKTGQAPVTHQAPLQTQIGELFVQNNQQVERGDPLLLLGKPNEYRWATEIKALLVKNHQQLISVNTSSDLSQKLAVEHAAATLVSPLNHLLSTLKRRQLVADEKRLQASLHSGEQAIAQYRQMLDQIFNKRKNLQAQQQLNQQLLNTSEQMRQTGLTTTEQLNQAKLRVLANQATLHDLSMTESLYQKEIADKQAKMQLQQIDRNEQLADIDALIQQQRIDLLSRLNQWMKQRLLKARISGAVSFHDNLHLMQNIEREQAVISISPARQGYEGAMTISGHGVGQITPQQRVNITLDAFNKSQFGTLEGSVLSVSQVPGNSGYLVKVDLGKQLTTSHGIDIDNQSYLKGQADIIVKPRRLLLRLFEVLLG